MTTIELVIDGVPRDALDPWQAVGSEAISRLYSFDVACNLLGDRPDPGIVGKSATLTIAPLGGLPRVIHGIVDRFRIASSVVSSRPPIVHVRVTPRFSLHKLYRQNHIFGTSQEVTVADLIEGQMKGTLRNGNLSAGFKPVIPYAMRLQRTYPSRDQVAQYEETNFDFLARQAERCGVFWFFENSHETEQVVFADSNMAAPFIQAPSPVDWHGWSAGAVPGQHDGSIQLLEALHDHVTAGVYLHDYNENTPNVDLTAREAVDHGTAGVWVETDRQIKTVEEGGLFASLTAEAIEARKFRLSGRSTVMQLTAGHAFQLRDHPFDDWNQNYLVVSVEHTMRVPRPDTGFEDAEASGYANRFVIQPLGVPFRPERVTRRPHIAGLLSGKIESNSNGAGPYMDDHGRYRVRMEYDLSNSPAGFGSRWMRLATPFAGAKDGLHFPLHPGTEVVVSHINGDPDRPVIVGAMFNPATPNVVTNAHPEQNRINFRSGMGLTAQTRPYPTSGTTTTTANASATSSAAAPTDAGGNSVFLWASFQNSNYAPSSVGPTPYQWLRLGQNINFTGDGTVNIAEGSNSGDGFDLATGGIGRLFAPRDLFLIRNGSATASANPETKTDSNNRLIAITDTGMLLAHDGTINIGESSGNTGYPSTVNIYSAGSINQQAGSDETTMIAGNSFKTTNGDTYALQYGNSVGFTFGSKDTIVGGANVNVYLVSNASLTVGLSLSSVAAMELKLILGGSFSLIYPYEFKLVHLKAEMAIKTSIEYKPFSFEVKPRKVDVTMLKSELDDIRTDVTNTQTEISTLNTRVNGMNTKVGQLDAEVGEVHSKVNSVTTSVSSLGSHISEMETQIGERLVL